MTLAITASTRATTIKGGAFCGEKAYVPAAVLKFNSSTYFEHRPAHRCAENQRLPLLPRNPWPCSSLGANPGQRAAFTFGENAISHNLILCNKANLLNQSAFYLGVPAQANLDCPVKGADRLPHAPSVMPLMTF